MNPISRFIDLFSRVEAEPPSKQVAPKRSLLEKSATHPQAPNPIVLSPKQGEAISARSWAVYGLVALVAGGLIGVSSSPLIWGLAGLVLLVALLISLWGDLARLGFMHLPMAVFAGMLVAGILIGLGLGLWLSPDSSAQLTKKHFMDLGLNEQEATALMIYQQTGLAPQAWVDTSASGFYNKAYFAQAQLTNTAALAAAQSEPTLAAQPALPAVETDTTDSAANSQMAGLVLARCADIMLDESMGNQQLAFAFQQGGVHWAALANQIEQLVEPEDFGKIIRQVYAGICQIQTDSLLTIGDCAMYEEAKSQKQIAEVLKLEGPGMASWVEAMEASRLSKQQRFDAFRGMVKAFCEKK